MYKVDETLRAIGRVMARYAQEKTSAFEQDEIIEAAPLLKTWVAGTTEKPVSYTSGDVRTTGGQPWKCALSHTHRGEDGWDPLSSRTLWSPYHARKKEYALPYVKPTGAHDAYNKGEWMVFTDGQYYMCKDDGTVHNPNEYPSSWEVYTPTSE